MMFLFLLFFFVHVFFWQISGEFIPSYEWQNVEEEDSVPPGLEIQMNLGNHAAGSGSGKIARVPDPWRLQLWVELDVQDTHLEPYLGFTLGSSTTSMTEIVSDSSAPDAPVAMVGNVWKACVHMRGCFLRMDVHKTTTMQDIKNEILKAICAKAVHGPELVARGRSALVCTASLSFKDGLHRGPMNMLDFFAHSSKGNVRASVSLSPFHHHRYAEEANHTR